MDDDDFWAPFVELHRRGDRRISRLVQLIVDEWGEPTGLPAVPAELLVPTQWDAYDALRTLAQDLLWYAEHESAGQDV